MLKAEIGKTEMSFETAVEMNREITRNMRKFGRENAMNAETPI